MELFLLHPAAVHFPVALLTAGWAAAVYGLKDERWAEAASWLLWAGTLSAWIALGLGLLAERTAPHVPSAWETLAEHETLGWWTVGAFTGLSLWRWRRGARDREGLLQAAAWLAACALLGATAWHGGELVYRHGMGVIR